VVDLSSINDVLQYIDLNSDRYLEYVKNLVRRPSVSAQNVGISDCAEYVLQLMEQVGLKARIFATKGNPIVYGESLLSKGKRTILFYNHYDVQPPEPLDQWISKPFEPEVREGKLFGRGAADNKGTFASRISAFESILKRNTECPLNVKFLVEGEEEIGSPNLASFAQTHRDLLEADAVVWEGSDRDISERPTVTLGYKGMLCAELSVMGPTTDQHSSKAPILRNPAWRLVWALNSLKSSDEKVLIDEFYDEIRPPTDDMQALLETIPFDSRKEKELAGVKRLAGSEEPKDALTALYFEPTLNINGLQSGYMGKGVKTILPFAASAKIDIRLVPDQDPDIILGKLEAHLRQHGFDDVTVETSGKTYPCRARADTQIAKVAAQTARQVYGLDPIVYPNDVGSAAMYVAVNILRKPAISIGSAYYGSGMHSPNEHIRIKDFLLAIKHVASILLTYG
jgi:acetylornithine deacetylase/succinyl-diaminopimelate desuccinylase-like protein